VSTDSPSFFLQRAAIVSLQGRLDC
jgi:hypothetical protein